jgi:uncharacterized protein
MSNGSIQTDFYTAVQNRRSHLIDEKVAAQWNIPADWKLIAQMPFGKPTAPAGDKEFAPLDERVKVYK